MKMFNKICAVALAVIMFASFAVVSASALDGKSTVTTVTNLGDAVTTEVDLGASNEIVVAVSLKTTLNVINSQGILKYDSSAATLNSLEYETVGGSVIVNTALKDKAAFNHTEFDAPAAFKDSADLIVAKFTALKAEPLTFTFNFDELNAVDASGNDVALVSDGVKQPAPFTAETVINPKEAPQVTLSAETKKLKAGKTYTLKVTGAENAKFSSSKKSVATVSKTGVITALKKGTANITVKAGDVKLTCKVTVSSNPTIKVGGKKFSAKKTYTVKKGSKLSVAITGKAKSINNTLKSTKAVKATGNKGASVKIKGVKKGTGTVTLKVNKAVTFKIKVKVY